MNLGFGLYIWLQLAVVSFGFCTYLATVGMLEFYFYLRILLADEQA